jgi:alpha-methylacyl-CoA racemase
MNLPLKGIKVLEFEGLAPTVFTGMVLADFGADVTVICRDQKNMVG